MSDRQTGAPVQHLPGHLADNLAGFTALLRRAGMPLGFEAAAWAAEALSQVDLRDRRQAKAALSAVLLNHQRDRVLFEAAFALFWREPRGSFVAQDGAEGAAERPEDGPQTPLPKRLEEALRAPKAQPETAEQDGVQSLVQASIASADERLRKLDFAAMSPDEMTEAEAAIRRLAQQLKPRPTRRYRAAGMAAGGGTRLDLRRSLNHMPRTGGDLQRLFWRRRVKAPEPLVILADVSGSMEAYIRPSLIFAHALAQGVEAPFRTPVETFVFATRLTSISRDLSRRDPDQALTAAVERVQDWSGGTRLGEILQSFNRQHSRRVLSRGGTVLLISDGLERGSVAMLKQEAGRLARFSRLWWLNPLMRYQDYAPTAQGAAVLEALCARRLPAHSLDSLAALGEALSEL